MAILVIKIENEASLMMNEFFDYNGVCWALSKSRFERRQECINLEDFYEGTLRTQWLDHIPVVFVLAQEDDTSEVSKHTIIGWYKDAKVYRKLQVVSTFLEGNICAKTMDARLLAMDARIEWEGFSFRDRLYQVLEDDDVRCVQMYNMMQNDKRHFIQIRYDMVQSQYQGDLVRMAGLSRSTAGQAAKGLMGQNVKGSAGYKSSGLRPVKAESQSGKMRDFCVAKAGEIAAKVMNDQCTDIRMLKTMYQYAAQAVDLDQKCVDGLYYLAMVCEQLGFIKEGFKAIEKALRLEPDGDDLIAVKGHLLFASGKYEDAAKLYEESYAIAPMDGYLICIGQAWFALGNVDKAYRAFQKVSDKKVLDDYGINLKDMERRWPFVALRGFSLKDFLGKKNK